MNRCKSIFLYKLFIEKHGVLIVITLPGEKTYKHIFTKRYFSIGSGRTVSNNFVCLNMLANFNYRFLIDAGSLIRTKERNKAVLITLTVITFDNYLISAYIFYYSGTICNYTAAAVMSRLVFHTRAYNRGLGFKKRNSLTLHVRAHKRTVGIVVFKERYKRGRN